MASASASTGRVICFDRNRASHTLEKKTRTVISSSIRESMVRWPVARAEELPVFRGAGLNARDGVIEPLRHGQGGHHDPSRGSRRHSQRVCRSRSRVEERLYAAPPEAESPGGHRALACSYGCPSQSSSAWSPESSPAELGNPRSLAGPCRRPPQTALQRDAMGGEHSLELRRGLIGAPEAAIDSASPRALLATYSTAPALRGWSLRESRGVGETSAPASDSQVIAEQVHQRRGRQGDDDGPQHHARSQPCGKPAAAGSRAYINFENGAEEQNQQQEQEQEEQAFERSERMVCP